EHLHALRPEGLGGRQCGKDQYLGDVAPDAVGLRGEKARGLLEDVLLEEPEYLGGALEHRGREDVRVPRLHRNDRLVDELKLRRKQEEIRLAARLRPG